MKRPSRRIRRPAAVLILAAALASGLAATAASARAAPTGKAGDGQPAPRFGHVLSTLPDGRILLFGGQDGAHVNPFDDTWIWDGNSFFDRTGFRSPLNEYPTPRSYAAMANGVMWGGSDLSPLAETWVYGVGGDFWQPVTGYTLLPDQYPAMCGLQLLNANGVRADSYRSSSLAGDTRVTYEHGTGWWPALATTPPPALALPAMASIGDDRAAIHSADLTTYLIHAPGGVGQWESVVMTSAPGERDGNCMAAESTDGNTYVVFGGSRDDARTWRLTQREPASASTWEIVATNGPPPRDGTGMAFDPARGTVVLFGGIHDGSVLGDLWEWTPGTNSWARRNCVDPVWMDLMPAQSSPALVLSSLAYDPDRRKTVLFGGHGNPMGTTISNVTWEYDGSAWTQVNGGGPTARYGAAMAYDPARHVMVLFGGAAVYARQDTWEWDEVHGWRRMATTGPPVREGAHMAYDAAAGKMTLFGGADPMSIYYKTDTWTWDGISWTQVATGGLPSPVEPGAGLAYGAIAPTDGGLLLYGGERAMGLYNGDCFLWNGTAWSLAQLEAGSPVPPARWRTALVRDAALGSHVIFGGEGEAGVTADTWRLDRDATSGQWRWSQIAVFGPLARSGHQMVYDPLRAAVTLTGGRDEYDNLLVGTWVFMADAQTGAQGTDSSQSAAVGQSVTLTPQFTGGVLACAWRHNGAPMPGVTGTTHTIAAVSPSDAGTYSVTAVGACSSEAYANITLSVEGSAPVITAHPDSQAVCQGMPVTFSVMGTGSPPLSYEWFHNGTSIGVLGPSFVLPAVTPSFQGSYHVVVSNASGSAVSDPAQLTVLTAPAFTLQPAGQSVCPGAPAWFLVAASGTRPLTYQWQLDGVAIAGATDSLYTIAATTTADQGQHRVLVGNACAAGIASQPASLTIGSGPVIQSQTPSATVCAGSDVTFAVTAIGATNWQWRKDGVAVGGATSPSLTLSGVTAAQAGIYDAALSSACGSVTSAPDTLTVRTSPQITQHPASQAMCGGGGGIVQLTVAATGTTPLSYRWQKNGADLPGPGAANATYLVPPLPESAGTYRCRVGNACQTDVYSNAAIVSWGGVVVQSMSPGTRVCAGAGVTFTVTATGATSYQWRRNGVDIPAATAASLLLPAVTPADAGNYTVAMMAASCGTTISPTATLTVDSAPLFGAQPISLTLCEPTDSGTLSVSAGGPPAPIYNWYQNGLPRTTTPQDIFSSLPVGGHDAQAGVYWAEAVNGCGTTRSSRATLTTACNPGRWELALTAGPPARRSPGLTHDIPRGRTVLFGGVDGTGLVYYGDTWERQTTGAWTQVATVGPSPREGALLVFDPLRGRTMLYGGHSYDGSVDTYHDDTWLWDGSTWTQVTGLTTTPGPRWGHGLTWDADNGRVLLFGGHASASVTRGDMWAWDGTAWTQLATNGPTARAFMGMGYDLAHGQCVVQGGQGSAGQQADTWTWDGAAWTQAANGGPGARHGQALGYDPRYNRLLLFGGVTGATRRGDTWSWDGAAWTKVGSTGLSPRTQAAMCYDSYRFVPVCFGGSPADAANASGETWEWREGATPSAVDPGVPAPAIAGEAELLPCQPNPFNPRTEVRFVLSLPLAVDLAIYDLSGRRVRQLSPGTSFAEGEHRLAWDGTRDDGRRVASGVYHLRMAAGRYVGGQRLVLVK